MANYLDDFRAGNTKKIKLNYGVDKDITGWKFRFVVLKSFGKTPVIDFTTTVGDHAEDVPLEGLAFIEIGSDVTALVKEGDYYYYVDRIIPGSPDDIKTILPPIDDHKDILHIRDK